MIDYATLLASIIGANQQKQTLGSGAVGTTAQKAPIALNNGTIPTAGTQRTAGSTIQNYGGYVSPGGQNTGSPVASGGAGVNYNDLLQQILAKLLQGRM